MRSLRETVEQLQAVLLAVRSPTVTFCSLANLLCTASTVLERMSRPKIGNENHQTNHRKSVTTIKF